MRAVGYRNPLPITDPEALIDTNLPDPTPNPRDLLVRVKAVSVNPVDVKVRAKVAPPKARCASWVSMLRAWLRLSDPTPRSLSRETRFTTQAPSRGRGPTPSSTLWMNALWDGSRRR